MLRSPPTGRRGNRQALQLQAELNPDVPVFPYPEDLKEECIPIWTSIVNTKTADYWTNGDIPLLRIYCRCVVDIERLNLEIEIEGEVTTNSKGNDTMNPKIAVRALAETRLMGLCNKLRMQPSSRVALETEKHHGLRKEQSRVAALVFTDDVDNLLASSASDNASMN